MPTDTLFSRFILLAACLMALAVEASAQARVFDDKKNGYFKFVPPAHWRQIDFPTDPRTKVEFKGADGVLMRLIVRATNSDDDELVSSYTRFMKFRQEKTAELRAHPTVRQITAPQEFELAGFPASRQRLTVKDGSQMEMIHFYGGTLFFNYAVSAPNEKQLESVLPLAMRSLETTVVLRNSRPGEAEAHLVARALRLGRLQAVQGDFGRAEATLLDALEMTPAEPQLKAALELVRQKKVPPDVHGRQ